MGMYDDLPGGSQIKCWNNLLQMVDKGDMVPDIQRTSNYIIILREGGFVRVKDSVVVDIVEDRVPYHPSNFEGEICFDKWGSRTLNDDELEGYYFDWDGM